MDKPPWTVHGRVGCHGQRLAMAHMGGRMKGLHPTGSDILHASDFSVEYLTT
jgi:hypothetical protein